MKFAIPFAAATAVALVSGAASAQSSKFAAAYDTQGMILGAAYACYETAIIDDVETVVCDADENTGLGFAAHMATIKAPQGKELLIGLSAVPGLVTFTEAKGKNGAGASSSVAIAGVGMGVAYAPVSELEEGYSAGDVCGEGTWAEPGPVPASVRLQYLSVSVDLDVVDVEGTCGGELQPDCVADTLDIEGDVTVALGLATAAAHHFNFIAPNLPVSGDYAVAACFVGGGIAAVLEGEGSAFSLAALGKRILTVQEVRAVKDAVFDVND